MSEAIQENQKLSLDDDENDHGAPTRERPRCNDTAKNDDDDDDDDDNHRNAECDEYDNASDDLGDGNDDNKATPTAPTTITQI